MSITPKESYQELISQIQSLPDAENKYEFLLELASNLEFDESQKTPANLMKGCQSKVWLYNQNGSIKATADSRIISGLLYLLLILIQESEVKNLKNKSLGEVLDLNIINFISIQRQNGLESFWNWYQNQI